MTLAVLGNRFSVFRKCRPAAVSASFFLLLTVLLLKAAIASLWVLEPRTGYWGQDFSLSPSLLTLFMKMIYIKRNLEAPQNFAALKQIRRRSHLYPVRFAWENIGKWQHWFPFSLFFVARRYKFIISQAKALVPELFHFFLWWEREGYSLIV